MERESPGIVLKQRSPAGSGRPEPASEARSVGANPLVSQRRVVAFAILAAAMVAAFSVDLPVMRWVVQPDRVPGESIPGEIRKLLHLSEVFAHGTGVAFILVTIFVLDPARRAGLLRVGCCAYGAGLAADLVKLLVARTRPLKLAPGGLEAGVWDTFVGFVPFNLDHVTQSFPSAHTATAFGLAVGLAGLYPRGRVWFLLLAVLAGLQRVSSANHFPSDVVGGALVGLLVGSFIFARVPKWPTAPRSVNARKSESNPTA